MDASKSFFVGDAAGRPKLGDRRKDFSASDVMFAVNAGIGFQTPEVGAGAMGSLTGVSLLLNNDTRACRVV